MNIPFYLIMNIGILILQFGCIIRLISKFNSFCLNLEKAASYDVSLAYMRLGDIYEKGLNRIDAAVSVCRVIFNPLYRCFGLIITFICQLLIP